jgi:hypothetical protein
MDAHAAGLPVLPRGFDSRRDVQNKVKPCMNELNDDCCMNDFLSCNRAANLVKQGNQAGFNWAVLHNGMGFRCGYVRIPEGHPWFGMDCDSIHEKNCHVSVHGGLTFSGTFADGHWVGFDCAHYGDKQDPSLPFTTEMKTFKEGEIRSTEYVQRECENLCEQAKQSSTHTPSHD